MTGHLPHCVRQVLHLYAQKVNLVNHISQGDRKKNREAVGGRQSHPPSGNALSMSGSLSYVRPCTTVDRYGRSVAGPVVESLLVLDVVVSRRVSDGERKFSISRDIMTTAMLLEDCS
jgi:hypothetical protein